MTGAVGKAMGKRKRTKRESSLRLARGSEGVVPGKRNDVMLLKRRGNAERLRGSAGWLGQDQ